MVIKRGKSGGFVNVIFFFVEAAQNLFGGANFMFRLDTAYFAEN